LGAQEEWVAMVPHWQLLLLKTSQVLERLRQMALLALLEVLEAQEVLVPLEIREQQPQP
jgi:hypothetical protein